MGVIMGFSIVRAMSALTFVASVVFSSVTTAQSVAVNGQVTGQGGPKQFASVSLEGPGRYTAITDAGGAFTIPNVTPGRYTVRVRQGNHVEAFTRDVGSGPIQLVVKW